MKVFVENFQSINSKLFFVCHVTIYLTISVNNFNALKNFSKVWKTLFLLIGELFYRVTLIQEEKPINLIILHFNSSVF